MSMTVAQRAALLSPPQDLSVLEPTPRIDYKDVKLLQRYISGAARSCRAASPRCRPRSSASSPPPSSGALRLLPYVIR
jgi:hypothetical protein